MPPTHPGWATQLASAFASVFVIGAILVAVVLIPAFFLPRSRRAELGNKPVVVH